MNIYRFDHNVKIYNLGDLHRGQKNCDEDKLHKIISVIEEDENARWVSTGDILETAIKSSKSSCYDAVSPEEELDLISEELKPIRGKCLGFVASNHQNRVNKEVGLSLDKTLADRAKIPYLGIASIIKVVCGQCAYFIHLHHGVGGGSEGNKVNRAIKLAQNALGCDVYLTGHTHTFSYVQDIQTIIDRKRDKLTDIRTHHVCTGHYIVYKGSYAEDMGLKEKPRGSSIVELFAANPGRESLKKVLVSFFG